MSYGVKSILDSIGNTPLIKIGKIHAKAEFLNPSGSIKDRMAWFMAKKAIQRNELKKGSKIIEATTGNTGISFAMISAIKGFDFIAVLPEFVSKERIQLIQAFGGKTVLTPKKENIQGTINKFNELKNKFPNAWFPKQFENPNNFLAQKQIGKELLNQLKKIDVFVAGIGSGGTIIGVAKALKQANSKTKIIGIEPTESAIMNGKKPGLHGIQGIGEGFIPKIVKENIDLIDEVIEVKTSEAVNESNKLTKQGLFVGISSGANYLVAKKLSKKFKTVTTVLPDRGERYLSIRKPF
ncbi:MAG: cysteine synthase family protein [Candidatus Diapherotrites archaeon]